MATRKNTPEDFWARVEKDDRCWTWTGAVNRNGYGILGYQGLRFLAHRLAWEFVNGPIPKEMCVCHHCDNPPCVNPAHLWLGTNAENNQDKVMKGRNVTPRGDQHYSRTRPGLVLKGERHGMARLTVAQVREVRKRAASGETQKAIAADLRICESQISRIVRGLNWKFVTG